MTTAKSQKTKKTTKQQTTVKVKKPATKQQSQKVDYYPNRVPLLVAATAAVTLLVFGYIAMSNSL